MTGSTNPEAVEDLDLNTKIGKVKVEGVIGNSPGPRKSMPEYHEVGNSPAAAITGGSFTLDRRPGNLGVTYWSEGAPNHILNALGLPGRKAEDWLAEIEELRRYGKPVIVSLAGFSREDFVELAAMFASLSWVSLELNFTCPNVRGHDIFAADFDESSRTIRAVRKQIGNRPNLIVKIGYHTSQRYIQSYSLVLLRSKANCVALGNTFPWGLILNHETLKPVITADTQGLAGLSGASVKPLMMGTVYLYRRNLGEEGVGIIAETGIWKGGDILEYFVAGADFCRIGGMYAERGAKAFTQLTSEFVEEMVSRGYNSLADIPRLQPPPLPDFSRKD